MELLNEKSLVFIVLATICHVSFSVSIEPVYTKFKYEEQLLEKVVRMEYFVENLAKIVNKSISDSVDTTKNINTITSNDIAMMKKDVIEFRTNITGVLEEFQQINKQWKENVEREALAALDEANKDINDTEKLLKAEIQATINKTLTETKQMKVNVERETSTALEESKKEIKEIEKLLKAEVRDLQATYIKQMKENVEHKTTAALDEAKKEINDTEKLLKAEIQATINKTLTDTREVTPVIAFSAYHVIDLSPEQSSPVIFDTVLLNKGNCYDTTTGYFTATVSVIYQFNAQLCAEKGEYLDYGMRINGGYISRGEYRTSSDSSDGKCTSFGTVVIVRHGQKVDVTRGGQSLYDNGYDWNSFSGVLIHPI